VAPCCSLSWIHCVPLCCSLWFSCVAVLSVDSLRSSLLFLACCSLCEFLACSSLWIPCVPLCCSWITIPLNKILNSYLWSSYYSYASNPHNHNYLLLFNTLQTTLVKIKAPHKARLLFATDKLMVNSLRNIQPSNNISQNSMYGSLS
jgi:hypothetical protein